MANSRLSGLGMTFLVGGVLLIAGVALVIAFVPLVECPDDHMLWITYPHDDGTGKMVTTTAVVGYMPITMCRYCRGTRRTTLLKKWTHRNALAR
jgi:hypothetical protein